MGTLLEITGTMGGTYRNITGIIDTKAGSITVDGNNILVAYEDIPRDKEGYVHIQMKLALASSVTWWKMLQVMELGTDNDGRKIYYELGKAELQDNNKGPASALDYHAAPGSTPPEYLELRFWKAKFLGVHTDMEHWLISGAQVLGKCITFTWTE